MNPISYSLVDLVKNPELRAKAREEQERWERENPEEATKAREEAAAQEARERAAEEWDRRRTNLKYAEAPARAVELWEGGGLTETPALSAVREFLKRREVFLLLSGGAGSGKTVATVEALAARRGQFAHAVDASSTQLYTREGAMELDQLRRAGILVVDDLGTEPMTDIWRAQFDRLIDVRYDARRPTILTTNLSPGAFRERYGHRVYDRLRGDEGRVFACGNESLRGQR